MNITDSMVEVQIGAARVRVAAGSSVAAALAQQPPGHARRSASGQWRAPLCGMGVCHECRVRIHGRTRLACQTACAEGMLIHTDVGAAPGSAKR